MYKPRNEYTFVSILVILSIEEDDVLYEPVGFFASVK